jgi:putative tricarboxylic transport membrane protein
MRHDKVTALFLLAVSVFFCVGSLPLGLGKLHNPGAGFIPFFGGILLGCLSLGIFISTLRGKGASFGLGKHWKKGAWVLGCLFFYLFVLNKIGFIITTFIFMILLLVSFRPRRWSGILLVSALTVVFSYLIFVRFLGVDLPKGAFGF